MSSLRKDSDYYSRALNRTDAIAHLGAYHRVAIKLKAASTQQEYDRLIPAYCEFATRSIENSMLEWTNLYDNCLSLRRDLLIAPALSILRTTNGVQRPVAALLCGIHGCSEATPLLIKTMTSGEIPSHLNVILNSTYPIKALAMLASNGDKQAKDYIFSHSNLESWQDSSVFIGRSGPKSTAKYLWGIVVEALIFLPSPGAIQAIESSGYNSRTISYLCSVVKNTIASGDAKDVYLRELFCNDYCDNKYFVADFVLNPGILSSSAKVVRQPVRNKGRTISLLWKNGQRLPFEAAYAKNDEIYDAHGFESWLGRSDLTYTNIVTNWVPYIASMTATNSDSYRSDLNEEGLRKSVYSFYGGLNKQERVGLRIYEYEDLMGAHDLLMEKVANLTYQTDFYLGNSNTFLVGDHCFYSSVTSSPFRIFFVRNNVLICLENKKYNTNSVLMEVARSLDKDLLFVSGVTNESAWAEMCGRHVDRLQSLIKVAPSE